MQPGLDLAARSRPSARVVLTVLTATLVGLLAVWASAAGPGRVLRQVGSRTPARREEVKPGVITSLPAQPHHNPASSPENGWVAVVVAIVLGIVLLAVVAVLVVVAVAVLGDRRRLRYERDAPQRADDEGEAIAAVAASMRADAAAQAALLEGDTPRNSIVACWHRFEQQAQSAGLARRAAETSSEFTLRLLDLVEADASSVGTLAALYREARFSEHELGEADRAAARAALDRIHTQLSGLLAVDLR